MPWFQSIRFPPEFVGFPKHEFVGDYEHCLLPCFPASLHAAPCGAHLQRVEADRGDYSSQMGQATLLLSRLPRVQQRWLSLDLPPHTSKLVQRRRHPKSPLLVGDAVAGSQTAG